MKPKTLVILGLILAVVGGAFWGLMREIKREEERLRASISGVFDVERALFAKGQADVVRTDRIVLILVDPESGKPVAIRTESPLVPPQTYFIGQEHALGGRQLTGPYLLVGITDKDGEIFKVTPGEVWGRSAQPVALGTEQFQLTLSEPFRGTLMNTPPTAPMAGGGMMGGDGDADPAFSISGAINVAPALKDRIKPTDRLVVLLFDPELGRPAAFKIIPHANLPQDFSITLPAGQRGGAKPGYFLRVISDRDNNPFGSAEGELVGRSTEAIPLGTKDIQFTLDQPYVR